jgi:hypothetical protein
MAKEKKETKKKEERKYTIEEVHDMIKENASIDPKCAFYESLSQFQSELPVIEKNKEVQVRMKTGGMYTYKYAELSFIWEKIRGVFTKNGFSYSQQIVFENNVNFLETKLFHKCGHVESSKHRLEYMGNDIKLAGGAISYWRRYALSALLGIVTNEDAEEMMPEEDDIPFLIGLTSDHLQKVQDALVRYPDFENTMRSLFGEIDKIPDENFEGVMLEIKKYAKESFLKKYGMDKKRTGYHEFIDFIIEGDPSLNFDKVLEMAIQEEDRFISKFEKWKDEQTD